MAVATNSRKGYFKIVMDALNVRKYFNVELTAQDNKKGKPDPEIYIISKSCRYEGNRHCYYALKI